MLDLNLKIVASRVLDISAGTSDSSAAFNLGRVGIPKNLYFVVDIEDASADATAKPFRFHLEVTTDNGTTWRRCGVIDTDADKAKRFAVPVGLHDFAPETFAAASIDVRVTTTWDSGAGTDDVTYSAWLAGPQGVPGF